MAEYPMIVTWLASMACMDPKRTCILDFVKGIFSGRAKAQNYLQRSLCQSGSSPAPPALLSSSVHLPRHWGARETSRRRTCRKRGGMWFGTEEPSTAVAGQSSRSRTLISDYVEHSDAAGLSCSTAVNLEFTKELQKCRVGM